MPDDNDDYNDYNDHDHNDDCAMSLIPWIREGKLVVDATGAPILCETCPCDEEVSCDDLLVPILQRMVATPYTFGIYGVPSSPLSFEAAVEYVNKVAHYYVQHPLAAGPYTDNFANVPPSNPNDAQTNPYCYPTLGDGGAVPETVTTCAELLVWLRNLRYVYMTTYYNYAQTLANGLYPEDIVTDDCIRAGVYVSAGHSSGSYEDAVANLHQWCLNPDPDSDPPTFGYPEFDELNSYPLFYGFYRYKVSGTDEFGQPYTTYIVYETSRSKVIYTRSCLADRDDTSSLYPTNWRWNSHFGWDWPDGCVQIWLQPGDAELNETEGVLTNFNNEWSNRGSFSLYDAFPLGPVDAWHNTYSPLSPIYTPHTDLAWGRPCTRETEKEEELWHYQYTENVRGVMAVHFEDIPESEWNESCVSATCA